MNRITMAITAAAALAAFLPATAQADSDGRLYVPLGSANAALILDSANGQAIGTIRDLPAVHGLAVTPDGKRLLAGSLMTGEAGKLPEKPAGMSEDEHASHHGGATKPAAEEVSLLTLVNAADGAILRRIPVPGAVHHVAISPDGSLAAATHPGGGAISLVDLHKGVSTVSVPTGPQPNYVAWSPDGKRLYVSNSGDGTLSELTLGHDISARKLRTGGSPEHLVLSADGALLYVNDADGGNIVEVDTAAWKVSRTFEIGGVLHGIGLSGDGERLFVAARERNEIATVDLSTGGIQRTKLGPEPYHLTVAPRVGKIYVSSAADSKLWVLDEKTLTTVTEIAIKGEGHQMAVW
jgi:DNA-binding beta-propeller fold protein YncE